jgi:hypothetical protein
LNFHFSTPVSRSMACRGPSRLAMWTTDWSGSLHRGLLAGRALPRGRPLQSSPNAG